MQTNDSARSSARAGVKRASRGLEESADGDIKTTDIGRLPKRPRLLIARFVAEATQAISTASQPPVSSKEEDAGVQTLTEDVKEWSLTNLKEWRNQQASNHHGGALQHGNIATKNSMKERQKQAKRETMNALRNGGSTMKSEAK